MAALVAAISIPAAASAQATAKAAATKNAKGLRAEMIKDVEDVEKKFISLAAALSGKYMWRPAEKVRSVGEVYMHIAGENYALPVVLSVKPPADFAAATLQEAFGSAAAMEKVTDEAEIKAAVEKSFAHIRQAIASIPESEYNKDITVFGQQMTKRGFLLLVVTHMHEHLGQMIAYARSNNVTPPWSANSGG